jgi:hypothetical protein
MEPDRNAEEASQGDMRRHNGVIPLGPPIDSTEQESVAGVPAKSTMPACCHNRPWTRAPKPEYPTPQGIPDLGGLSKCQLRPWSTR